MASITRSALIKWTTITTICAAHSFYWGLEVTKKLPYSWVAMVLGVLTLIAVFTLIESHPRYISLKSGRPSLAAGLRWGIRIRCLYAFLPLIYALTTPKSGIFEFLIVAEVYIGATALMAVEALTGNNLSLPDPGNLPYLATYLATLITAAIHTVILAILCLAIYGVLAACRKSNS